MDLNENCQEPSRRFGVTKSWHRIESGERRWDGVEFVAVERAEKVDPMEWANRIQWIETLEPGVHRDCKGSEFGPGGADGADVERSRWIGCTDHTE